jgi:1,4-dihydroxy-2-naphthoyl-CoA hydrolase
VGVSAVDLAENFNERAAGFLPGLLGVRFLSATPDRIEAELAVRDELCTVPGVLHGGAVMAFADTLGAHGTALNLPQGAGTTTIESKTNFFAPAVAGTTIRGESLPLHRGKRTMVWQTRVTAEDGRLIALVVQTQMVLEPRRDPGELLQSLFSGKAPVDKRALLAQLERGGGAVYRALAAEAEDEATRRAMLEAAEREEQNANMLDSRE